MKNGFIKVAAATPRIKVADCDHNAEKIIELSYEASARGVRLIAFPELCITGYTCGDLFTQTALIDGALNALGNIICATSNLDTVIAVGLPMYHKNKLYNCAAVIHHGRLLGVIPKSNIPNYGEFYEKRHFVSGQAVDGRISPFGYGVRFGSKQLFTCVKMPEFCFGVEICEDMWVPNSPSVELAREGAVIMLNLSASNEVIGKAEYRRTLVKSISGRLTCGYVYADAGCGESTTDLVFSGHNIIAQDGAILCETKLFSSELLIGDIDTERLLHERRRMNSFPDANGDYALNEFDMELIPCKPEHPVDAHPFVPSDENLRAERCDLILKMQATGLATRLCAAHTNHAVIGISGGLDSTLALLVTVRAFDMLKLDKKQIIALTMPCFGTTMRTLNNARELCASLGVSLHEINIADSVRQHFIDIGHDESVHDTTYENSQARERTQVLMDTANAVNGLVIGTGDLSELALGWATYNGDHMSMYGVNASVPKTLVRYLVEYVAKTSDEKLSATLYDVLATPVSPELLPAKDGEISQVTEDIVGPYELHDFYLYYMLRWGFTPEKILMLAKAAFADHYTEAYIKKWLRTFYTRFFTQQFKRSCMPDGPKIGSVTLSPRGDWRMPSDASSALWLKWCEENC